jgi:putative endopeptidase
MLTRLFFVCGLVVPLLTGCNRPADPPATAPATARTSFFDRTGMDTTVRPGQDFFNYANGAWIRKTTIPTDQSSWGSFTTLYEENLARTRAILTEAASAQAPAGSLTRKVGDFYASGMDTVTIEKRGMEPIKAEIARIMALRDYKQLLTYAAADKASRGGGLIGISVGPDDRQSSINRLSFGQTGLTLPEKGYYTRRDLPTKAIREAFLAYAVELFALTGAKATEARKRAAGVLALEAQLAASHKTPEALRDPVANYHKLTVTELTRQAPNLDWPGLLRTMGLKTDTVLVSQPAYYVALSRSLPVLPMSLWRDKLLFDYLDRNAVCLTRPFEKARFRFYEQALQGQTEQTARYKRVVNRVDAGLGDALGELWVKTYFPPAAKTRMLALVDNLQSVYRARIEKLDWMAPETKKIALLKLDRFVKKIGYPDKWKTYDDVIIRRDQYFENVQQVRQHAWRERFAKINRPVDKAEWQMTAPTVNAYADPTRNEVVFPAGILQFPFFDNAADDAINYGGIGMVIGHEMTHLFDDQGRQYDPNGNLRNWWTPADAARFTAKAQTVVEQYGRFTVLDNLPLNGKLTLGENLADLGGLTLAWEAFKQTPQGRAANGRSQTRIDGFTPDQRFFLGFAQIWRIKTRDETTRLYVQTDPHAPEKYRVNGPLANFPPFYTAFAVKPGDALYKPSSEQAKIW